MQLLIIFLLLSLGQMAQSIYQQNFHFSTSLFEQDLQNQQQLQKSYLLNDDKENSVAKIAKSVSEFTIETIHYVVYVIGDLITLLIN